jgi:anti-anti-sigma factor
LLINPPEDFHEALIIRRWLEPLASRVTRGTILIVDLSAFPFLNSSAIGELLLLYKAANGRGRKIKLVVGTSNPRVHELLREQHLDQIFAICRSVEESLRDVAGSA